MLLQDPDQAAIALLDLTFRRPAARDGTGAERCETAQIDEEHFRSRPGLRVLQMGWHPGTPFFHPRPLCLSPLPLLFPGPQCALYTVPVI